MKLFIVQRSGVYDQGISGIFSTLELAIAAMEKAKSREIDDYHHFSIGEYTLDKFYDLCNEWELEPSGDRWRSYSFANGVAVNDSCIPEED